MFPFYRNLAKKNKTVQMFCSYYTKIYYKNKFRNEHIPEFIFYRQ